MTAPSLPVRVGIVGATPITVELGNGVMGGNPVLVKVTLSQNYTMENPPGYPQRPETGGAKPFYPRVLASGETHSFLKPESDALVTAGAASYA